MQRLSTKPIIILQWKDTTYQVYVAVKGSDSVGFRVLPGAPGLLCAPVREAGQPAGFLPAPSSSCWGVLTQVSSFSPMIPLGEILYLQYLRERRDKKNEFPEIRRSQGTRFLTFQRVRGYLEKCSPRMRQRVSEFTSSVWDCLPARGPRHSHGESDTHL